VLFNLRGIELKIDFLRSLYGISNAEVIASKLGIVEELTGKTLYVMHPVHALASRLINAYELKGRLTEENLARLRLSIDSVRAYLIEQLSGNKVPRAEVLAGIERIFELSVSRAGLAAWRGHRIDTFAAVPALRDLARLPAGFLEQRYPRMGKEIERRREVAPRKRKSGASGNVRKD
jgi:hypothetical protein